MGTAEYPTHKTVLKHYGFFKDPFGEQLDPDLFFPAGSHLYVLDSVTQGLARGVCLQAIVSDPGVGKTTTLKLLQNRLRGSEAIFHRQPKLRPWESLKYLLLRLGIKADSRSMEALYGQLVEVLENRRKAGVTVSLIIDEAQNLGEQVLAFLQDVGAKQSGQAARLRVVLGVQASSREILRGLGCGGQRCPIFELKPLKSEEIGAYIAHRLKQSGSEGQEVFTSGAVREVAEYSRGVPREINMVCSEALRLCLESGGIRTVDGQCVQKAILLRSGSHQRDAAAGVSAGESLPARVDERDSFNPEVLLSELEHWFARHDHNWSGTRSELLTALQGQSASLGLSGEKREDLDRFLDVLEDNQSELAKSGIGVSVNAGVATPLLITLQHTETHADAKETTESRTEAPPTDARENEHHGELRLEGQGSPQATPTAEEPTATKNPASALRDGEEDSTDVLRKALRDSNAVDDQPRVTSSGRSKLLITILILVLIAVALVWARKVLSGKSEAGIPDPRPATDRTTKSGDGKFSLLKLIRDAESGDPASQIALADLYESGDRIDRNDTEAARWLREAASHGEGEAAYRLANAYKTGRGLPLSKVDAYCWYVIAAKTGHAESEQQIRTLTPQLTDRDIANVRYQLGQMHLNGIGTRPDKPGAFFWFRLAEVAGNPTATSARQAVASEMTKEEARAADEKATKWLQSHPSRSAAASSTPSAEIRK